MLTYFEDLLQQQEQSLQTWDRDEEAMQLPLSLCEGEVLGGGESPQASTPYSTVQEQVEQSGGEREGTVALADLLARAKTEQGDAETEIDLSAEISQMITQAKVTLGDENDVGVGVSFVGRSEGFGTGFAPRGHTVDNVFVGAESATSESEPWGLLTRLREMEGRTMQITQAGSEGVATGSGATKSLQREGETLFGNGSNGGTHEVTPREIDRVFERDARRYDGGTA